MRVSRAILTAAFLLLCVATGCAEDGDGGPVSADGAGGQAGPPAPVCDDSSGDGAGPYADLYAGLGWTGRVPVRGRLVNEDEAVDKNEATPLNQFSQDEIENATVQIAVVTADCVRFELGELTTDPEGYLDGAFDGLELPAGVHRLEVSYQGRVAGTATTRVLPPDYAGHLVRSDVDQTWLDTRFMGTTDKLELLVQQASERDTLPAMNVVYPALAAGADGEAARAVVFLSGSPRFFKQVLEAKLIRDGITADGLVLKPFTDIIIDNILDLDVDEISAELHEQIGYKVYHLLRLRLDVPAAAREILMGDDTEADAVAYALYHRFTAGELDEEALAAALVEVGVVDPWLGQIRQVAPAVTAHLVGAPSPVQTIYINRTDGLTGEHFAVADWRVPGITRYHTGAWSLILDLYEDDRVSAEGVLSVKTALVERGQDEADMAASAAAGVEDGFLDATTAAAFADQ